MSMKKSKRSLAQNKPHVDVEHVNGLVEFRENLTRAIETAFRGKEVNITQYDFDRVQKAKYILKRVE